MSGDIILKVNKKVGIAVSLLIGVYAFADFVSIVDSKSAGGIIVEEEQLPAGSITMWGGTSAPDGWLELNGGSTAGYPELIKIYGANLPDFRGQFVRAWDNGAGLDSGRSILSNQGDAMRNLTGTIGSAVHGPDGGAFRSGSGVFAVSSYDANGANGYSSYGSNYKNITIDASRQVPVANEIRPRNVSVMYIVKAE